MTATPVDAVDDGAAASPRPAAGPAGTSAQDALARRLRARQRSLQGDADSIGRLPAGADAPLSCGQERLWLTEQIEPESRASNFTFVVWLRGDLDVAALQRALTELHRRQHILRTVFVVRDGVARQRVLDPSPVELRPRDFRHHADPAAEARRAVSELGARPYRLTEEPGVRWQLIRTADGEHALAVCMHHGIADAWSEGVLRRELSALYAAERAGVPAQLPEPVVQYADYAAWQRRRLSGGSLRDDIAALIDRFSDAPASVALPGSSTTRATVSDRAVPGGMVTADLSADLVAGAAAAAGDGVSTFMVMLAAFSVVLARYCGQDDLVIGAPVAGRSRPELESLIGFFVNTIPIRVDLSGDLTFAKLLARVRDEFLRAYARQDVPLDHLVDQLRPAREPGRQPLVQVLFQLVNTPDVELILPGLDVAWEQLFDQTSPLDLSVSLVDSSAGLTGYWQYRDSALSPATVESMHRSFERVVHAAVADRDVRVGAIALTDEAEREALLAWGRGGVVAESRFVHEAFEDRARELADQVAVVADGVELTYQELSARSDAVAGRLRGMGVGPGQLVGVLLPRGLDVMVAVLGALKAGAGYLPLDPAYPQDRLRLMTEDAAPAVVITRSGIGVAPAQSTATVLIDTLADDDHVWEVGPGGDVGLRPDDVAYVIYTSGSTGRPKGTAVTHRNLSTHLRWALDAFPQTGRDGTLVHSALGFDFTVTPMFLSLLSGRRTVMVTDGDVVGRVAAELSRSDRDYSWVKLTPAHLDALRAHLPADARISSVRTIVVGGEQLRRDAVEAWQRLAPDARIINEYGPTETTVGVMLHEVPRAPSAGRVPIGRPVVGSSAYVLDREQALVPVGVIGELHIGGDVVSRCYIGRPALTAERFVPDPFADSPGARMYRTGDLVRWRDDGELDFVGRIDGQVKVRGHRVEPGEIEAVLSAHPGVRQAAVAVGDLGAGDRVVVGYWVPAGDVPDDDALVRWLRAQLPDFMVPGLLHRLDELPVNAHGKVDRSRLPDPRTSRREDGERHVAPRTDAERLVTRAWADVLGVDRIGITDDFFVLGGSSLAAARMAAAIAADLTSVDVPTVLRALFSDPRPVALAAALERRGDGRVRPRIEPRGSLRLSHGQRALWFHSRLVEGTSSYLCPVAVRLLGEPDATALRAALSRVIARHEVLRTGVRRVDGEPVAVPLAADEVPLRVVTEPPSSDAEAATAAIVTAELAAPFDLARELPIRASLTRLDHEDWLLVVLLHHIASDAESIGLLLDELAVHYRAALAGSDAELPDLEFQYADYAAWHDDHLASDAAGDSLAYWREALADPPTADLPLDHARTADASAGTLTTVIDPVTCAALRQLAAREGATFFMTLAAALRVLLARWSGDSDIAIGTPASVRADVGAGGLVGFFVNTVVLRSRIAGGGTFGDVLRAEKGAVSDALAHQDVPFDVIVRELRVPRVRFRNPLFHVIYAHTEAAQQSLSLPGLRAEPVRLPAPDETPFDLSLDTVTTPDGALESTFTFARALFDPETIATVSKQWTALLHELVSTPASPDPVVPTGGRQP